jgi:hypothetical protein
VFITENINPERGLVNSTAVTYRYLVLNRERIAEQLMSSASKEDIAYSTLQNTSTFA